MSTGHPLPVSVTGGADGIEAHCDDMVTLARLYGQAASDVGGAALALHGYLLDPGLCSSGLLDPGGLARFEAALTAALDGPHGLTMLAGRCGANDVALRTAAATYDETEHLVTRLWTTFGPIVKLPIAMNRAQAELLRTGSFSRATNTLLTDDPGLADDIVTQLGPAFGPAEAFYADGTATVQPTGPDPADDAGGPPRDLAAVFAGLVRRNTQGDGGQIDVRRLVGRDGRTYVIVDIPGTRSWSVAPHNPNVTSLASNLRAVQGQHTTYEDGVLKAMRAAGVTSTDRVMLVGHSLGGTVAVKTATDCAASGEFHVTNVVTAGSPIGQSAPKVPSSVQVLAIENEGDVVPHLDGSANPDRPNITTVTVAHNHGNVGENHDLSQSYLPGAEDIGASTNGSVRAYLDGASGFFTATSVSTTAYVIGRSG